MADPGHDFKKAVIAMLLKLQSTDASADLREFAYIHKVAMHLGLSTNDVQKIEQSLENVPVRPPANEKERMTILYYLLFLMEVDGKVTPREESLVREFGLKLGFRIELTDELIQIVKSHPYRRIPSELMLKKIKKYLN